MQEWCTTAFERLEIHGFIVRRALLPTPIKHAAPCESQGAYGRLVRLALGALLLIIDLGPEGMPRGCRGPLHARVAQERRALEAPGPPGLLATACRDRCATRLLLACRGSGVAFPLCTQRVQEPRGQDRPGPWQGVKPGQGRLCLGAWRPGVVAVFASVQRDAELADKGVDQQRSGGHDARIRGQGDGTLEGLETGGDDGGGADVVGLEEGCEGGTTREWRGFAGRPAAEDVAQDRGLLLLHPLQNLRERVGEGPGQPMGPTDWVADQTTAVCAELCQGAQRGAWRGEGGELVAVCEEQGDLECGLGRVSCGPARGQRCTVRGPGERMKGKEDEASIWAQGGHARPCLELPAHRHRWAVEARGQALAPRVDRFRTVGEAQPRPVRGARGWSAASVLGLGPGEAHQGGTCFGGL